MEVPIRFVTRVLATTETPPIISAKLVPVENFLPADLLVLTVEYRL